MSKQAFRDYIFPLLFNLAFTLVSIFRINSFELNELTISIILVFYLIPCLLYFLLYFTIGRLFKNRNYRLIISLSITYLFWGILFKTFHWPFATWMLTVSLFVLGMCFLFLLLKKRSNKN